MHAGWASPRGRQTAWFDWCAVPYPTKPMRALAKAAAHPVAGCHSQFVGAAAGGSGVRGWMGLPPATADVPARPDGVRVGLCVDARRCGTWWRCSTSCRRWWTRAAS